MVDKPLRQTLLDALAAAEDRERVLVDACDGGRTGDPETWTARDHLVHLAYWRRHAARVLENARTGGPPEPSEPFDEINARVYAANKERSASSVKADVRESYRDLRAAIEATTDEQLLGPRPGRAGALWEVVPGDGHLHTGTHLGYWLQSQGDQRAADEVQVWMHDLHVASFPTDEQRAYAAYNLGCHYALAGRADSAIPLFTKAIDLKPDLRELARTDHDLDAIRDHSAIARLLA